MIVSLTARAFVHFNDSLGVAYVYGAVHTAQLQRESTIN